MIPDQLTPDEDLSRFYGTKTPIHRTPEYKSSEIYRFLGSEYYVFGPSEQSVIDKFRKIDEALVDFCEEGERPGIFARGLPRKQGNFYVSTVLASAFRRGPPYFRPMRLLRLLNYRGA